MKSKVNTMVILILMCIVVSLISWNAERLAVGYINYTLQNEGS